MKSFLAVLSSLILLALSNAQSVPSGSCKWIPGQAGWPTDADWQALNQTVKGRLLRPDPPGAPCYEGYRGEVSCDSVTRGFRDSTWHANHPTSSMWQNYNNYSCMPSSGNSCSTAGFPLFVVEAQEASDVKAAVDFARVKNIRLNIKSTGHDFLGRSVQPFSLSIWTHKLNQQTWYETSFSPKGCRIQIPGAAVTVGSGSHWNRITSAASSRGFAVVSGAFSTVSVGGFLANGGHGRLSSKFGLGADQVYEIELVTPMGQIITANECQNQDYFWAMRGGGGSTYGVVLTYTIKALPSMSAARYYTSLRGWDEIVYWYQQWPKIAMIGGGGYFNGYPGRGGAVTVTVSVPNATRDSIAPVLDPILEGMGRSSRSGGPSSGGTRGKSDDNDDDDDRRKKRSTLSPSEMWGTYTEYKTWAEFEADNQRLEKRAEAATFPGIGQNKIIASWLWSEADLADPNLRTALTGAFDNDAQMLNDATMGPGTHNPPYIRGGGNAVNPAFRTAVMRPATELQWSSTDYSLLARKKADALRFVKSYMSIAPNGGTYANEADPDTPNWQTAFWGSNYPRLLNIKRRVDPYGVLYCRSCVGSELWEDNYGQLCKL